MKKIIISFLLLLIGFTFAESIPSFPMSLYGNIQIGTTAIFTGTIKIYNNTNDELSSYIITKTGKYGAETAIDNALVINEFSEFINIKIIYNGTTYSVAADQINDINKGEGCPNKTGIFFVSKNCRYDITLTEQSSGDGDNGGGGGGGGGGGEEETEEPSNNTGTIIEDSQNLTGEKIEDITIEGLQGVSEIEQAYIFAYNNGITTKKSIEEATMENKLTRAEMAKMMSEYAIKILGKIPNKEKICNFKDTENMEGDLPSFIKTSCQLGIMGVTANGEVMEYFNPYGLVNRGQFGTVLSRVLWGDRFNLDSIYYYKNHLKALKNLNIIKDDNPNLEELRGWVMLMLMRSYLQK